MATTPLVGTEILPIVQGGVTDQVTVANLTVGRAVSMASGTITGDLTVDTNTLKVDSTNNRVGVGTASPVAALQVGGGSITPSYNYGLSVQHPYYAFAQVSAPIATGVSGGYLIGDDVTGFAGGLIYDYVSKKLNIRADKVGSTIAFSMQGTSDVITIDTASNLKLTYGNLIQGTAAKGITTSGSFALGFGTNGSTTQMSLNATGSLSVFQAPTASAPTYVKGAMYFDTTLNKLRIGGATAWETVTSI